MNAHLTMLYESLAVISRGNPVWSWRQDFVLKSRTNDHRHFRAIALKAKTDRGLGIIFGKQMNRSLPDEIRRSLGELWAATPCFAVVHLCRRAPDALDDDNLTAAFKSFRDGIAEAIYIDDGYSRVRYVTSQEHASKHSVLVELFLWRGRSPLALGSEG